jgi:hypothetical protein
MFLINAPGFGEEPDKDSTSAKPNDDESSDKSDEESTDKSDENSDKE